MRRLVAIGFAVVVTACGAGSTDAGSYPDCIAIGPTVSPPSATVRAGDTVRATASMHQCPGQPTVANVFRFSAGDTAIAMVDSTTGLVRAQAPGRTSITASLVANPVVKGAMALTVVP